MTKNLLFKTLPFCIVILTVFSVQQWLKISVSSTTLSWILNSFIIYIILRFRFQAGQRLRNYTTPVDNGIISIYLTWLLFNSIRGSFIAENYWEWKQLINGIQTLSLPILIYIFSIPVIQATILRYWFKYALILFAFLLPFLGRDAYHFFLGPIFLVGCFLSLLSRKWILIIGGLLAIMLFIDLGARSQVIKSAMVLLTATAIYFRKFISYRLIRIIHGACYVFPIILLYLGITGTFNIFEDLASNKGKYVQKKVVNGQVVEDDLSADTRTFIYVEVLESALRHNYVIWGRTPARGNDSMAFGTLQAEDLKTGKYERHRNELCHPNVFTWLGLVGVILYSLIYLRSSFLSIYRSNNSYIKILGCFIAFRWAYGWIEDINGFNIMNFSLWMTISMGLSIRFRSMTDKEFRTWIKSIFTPYLKNKYFHEKNSMAHRPAFQ